MKNIKKSLTDFKILDFLKNSLYNIIEDKDKR